MAAASLTCKNITDSSAVSWQRFNSALHRPDFNLHRAILLQTVGISYHGRLHVCWITLSECSVAAWNGGSEMSCYVLSNQNGFYGFYDKHLQTSRKLFLVISCMQLAFSAVMWKINSFRSCMQGETEKKCCGPAGFRNLGKQKTLWAGKFGLMWTTLLTLCLLLCSLLRKQHLNTAATLGQIFLSFWEMEPVAGEFS